MKAVREARGSAITTKGTKLRIKELDIPTNTVAKEDVSTHPPVPRKDSGRTDRSITVDFFSRGSYPVRSGYESDPR